MKKGLLLMGIVLTILVFCSCKSKEYDSFATIYGLVTDSDTTEPIAGVSVTIAPGGFSKTTGSDGHFEFDNLDPQQYRLTAQKPPTYKSNFKTVTAVVGEKNEANIQLTKNN